MEINQWLFNNKVFFGAHQTEANMSHLPLIHAYKNNWRLGDRCLDLNLRVGRWMFALTFWDMPFQKTKGKVKREPKRGTYVMKQCGYDGDYHIAPVPNGVDCLCGTVIETPDCEPIGVPSIDNVCSDCVGVYELWECRPYAYYTPEDISGVSRR